MVYNCTICLQFSFLILVEQAFLILQQYLEHLDYLLEFQTCDCAYFFFHSFFVYVVYHLLYFYPMTTMPNLADIQGSESNIIIITDISEKTIQNSPLHHVVNIYKNPMHVTDKPRSIPFTETMLPAHTAKPQNIPMGNKNALNK